MISVHPLGGQERELSSRCLMQSSNVFWVYLYPCITEVIVADCTVIRDP